MTFETTAAEGRHQSLIHYDTFQRPGGYTLDDYGQKWTNPYGIGEMAHRDTRLFAGGKFTVSAVPFTIGADVGVFDHLKYIAISSETFPVPELGSITISCDIAASTPGTHQRRIVHGTYTATGAPYEATVRRGQQAGAVLNAIDFTTGQLFDWFVTGQTAFALIERLPSTVTGNTTDETSPAYVGRDKMYTQIIREVPIAPGRTHQVAIRYSQDKRGSAAEYLLDGEVVSKVGHVGIPLDEQRTCYTGTYPSLGPGEELSGRIASLAIGHGLFSLMDAFPFQHPDAPELSVSIPMSERLFGQGAIGQFDRFDVATCWSR
jgi:Family of unknown function (DUF6081)